MTQSENWQSGQKILKQDMQYAQASADSAINDRQVDNFNPGIAQDLLNGMVFSVAGVTSVTVGTGTGYNSNGERIEISSLIGYNDANTTLTTPDGIGGNTSTPQSSGSQNIPMSSGTINMLYIQYLGTINPNVFTLHKLTNQKLFTEISDGYEIAITTVTLSAGVFPTTSTVVANVPSYGGPWLFLGYVDFRAGGNISSSMFNISLRPLYEININRTQGTTPLANFSNITPAQNYGPNLPVTFDAHVKAIGSTVPTNRNPHGLTLQDIGFSGKTVEQHEEFLHAPGIANGNESPSTADSFNLAVNPRCPDTDELIIYGLNITQFLVMPAASGTTSITFGNTNFPGTTLLNFGGLSSGTYYIWIDSSLAAIVLSPTAPVFAYQFLLWTITFNTTKGATTIPGSRFLVPPSGPCAGTSNFTNLIDNRLFGNTSSANLQVNPTSDTFNLFHNLHIIGKRLQSDDEVGIGIDPNTFVGVNSLGVNGYIQSYIGGYRFPDNTVQTTAAVATFRSYAQFTLFDVASGSFTVTAGAFTPNLTITIIPTLVVTISDFQSTAPGGAASAAGFHVTPGSPFNGTTIVVGVFQNVHINDQLNFSLVFNGGAGGGTATWMIVAHY
jgi:hypothetical protein